MSADPRAQSIVAFLRENGAGELRHSGAVALLDHLTETYAILQRWGQPAWLQHAGLLHSVYGTPAFRQELLPASRRDEVAGLAGQRAERLAFKFGSKPLSTLAADTGDEDRDSLLMIHLANLAEQARARDSSPGHWLVRLAKIAELLIGSDTVRLPRFIAELATFTDADEASSRRAYLDGTAVTLAPEARESRLALAAATCAVVPEPCVWLAHLAGCRGDTSAARDWANRALRRQLELGTVWDKRLSFDQWLELAERLERASAPVARPAGGHPRILLEAVRHGGNSGPRQPMPQPRADGWDAVPARFGRYVESLGSVDGSPLGAIYPELPSRPWYDPQDFPLVEYLESHYTEIREEILSLEPSRFHPESEPIHRSGAWDVAFLYERGRRHDEVCRACPVTTAGIEAYPTVRTLGGLIYASRLRGATHISAHRGPTNLRVRCHLALQVPDGDCAIRVGDETRRWQEGACLVFDEYFEHEAWNSTDEDRIVLIVDMWHPGLSALEVDLLTGLQGYAAGHAHRLARYWSTNATAARTAGLAGARASPRSRFRKRVR